MIQFGYQQGQTDHTLFIKQVENGKRLILIMYVDDMVIAGDDIEEIKGLKMKLQVEFKVKELGTLKYFLGMEIARSKQGIFITQRKYTLDLLNETGKLGCRLAGTPLERNWEQEVTENDSTMDKERYNRLVGKLIYLSLLPNLILPIV